MTTTKTRLVFGSKEAQEIILKSRKNAKNKEIKGKLKSIASELEDLSDLTASVEVSVGEFSTELWILADLVNSLMIDLRESKVTSAMIDDAHDAWDAMIDAIKQAKRSLDNNDPSKAFDTLSKALQVDKYQPQLNGLKSLTNNFTY